ncbi:centrosomal protein of 89 kDa-like [Saccostrea echinata]|uniref:centrosomal protein of 89 kDa-like n=1 Tax=Saccostrea echinata TaxID=191078 RepID=UPI002A830659|nr:centrosomal protein of 89 kDa-like [Saccostrea echinata]
MAGKTGRKGKGKGSSLFSSCYHRPDRPHTSQRGNISSGLIPSAAFAVVPRTPGPDTPPDTNIALASSSGTLNASLLAKARAMNPPTADDDPFSDPESSLYDYQVMEEAGKIQSKTSKLRKILKVPRSSTPVGSYKSFSLSSAPVGSFKYSSVEFGQASGSRKRISYSDREPAPVPGPSSLREHAIDEEMPGQFYHTLEKQEDIEDRSALYAKPVKKGKRTSQAEDATLQQTGQRVREAYRQVIDPDSDEIQEEMTTQKVTTVTIERAPTPIEKPGRHSTPREMQEETLVKSSQEDQSKPVETDDKAGASPSPRRSGRQSGSNTARSISEIHTARSTDKQQRGLEGQNALLRSINESLEEEVTTFRRVTAALEKGDRDTAATLLLKKQLTDMKDENEVYKNTIYRLNKEFSELQTKSRVLKPEERAIASELLALPNKGPCPSWLINTKYLSPLFLAYDDRLEEREKIINRYQLEIEKLKLQAEDIVTENQQLQEKFERIQTENPVDQNDWENLKENARLVLEENQNLLEQIEVKDQKSQDMHQAHMQEVSKVTKQLVLLKAEKADQDQDLEEIKRRYKELKTKYDAMVLENQGQSSAESYINTIAELKRSITEKEENYHQEVQNLKIKIQAIQEERRTQSTNFVELQAENKRCQAELRAMRKAIRKAQSKMVYLQKAIDQSELKEQNVQDQLASVIKVAEKTAYERDSFAKAIKDRETEAKKAMNKMLQNSVSKGKMEEKLKLYKLKAAAKINTVAGRLKEQDEVFTNQKKEYEREINHLRLILQEKDHNLHDIVTEKREVEDELEIVWQAANSENDRMKTVLQKTVKKLRQHEQLAEVIDQHEPKKIVYVSSDGEGD